MADAVINPNSSPATILFDQNDKNREGFCGKDASFLSGLHTLNDLGDGFRHTIREVSEGTRHTLREVAEASRHGIRETSENSRHLSDLLGRNLVEIKDADLHNADRTRALEKEICHTRGEIIAAVERTSRATELAVEKTAAATQRQLCDGFAAVQLEAAKNAAAAALAAATNTAAIQAAIAECCCEQKELTRAEAAATRDLINSLSTQDLQRQLSDAKAQVAQGGIVDALLAKLAK